MTPPLRIAVAAAIVVTGYFASNAVRGLAYEFDNFGVRLSFDMLGNEIGFGLLAVGLALALPGPMGLRLGLEPGRLPWSAVAAVAIGTLGLSAAIDGVLTLSRAAEGSKVVGISRDLATTPGAALAFVLLGTAVAPGVCEEILCRGLVQRSVARWAGPAIAVPVAAVFFGWLHQEWVHGSIATAIGIYLGVTAVWADSTRPTIAAHTLNNAFSLLASMGLLRVGASAWVSIGVGLALAAGGLVWVARTRLPAQPARERREPPLQPEPESADG